MRNDRTRWYSTISIPVDSFFRALESHYGKGIAKGNLQVSHCTFVALDTWKFGRENVSTQAGKFAADKVAVRPDVATMLPSWPAGTPKCGQPLLPKLALDYDAGPPHHLINFHGPMGWPAPAVDLQLVHRYVAPAPSHSATDH